MAERPLLVSGPLIGPILRGKKTVTRRIVKKPARAGEHSFGEAMEAARRNGWAGAQKRGPEDGIEWRCACPYGAVGDVLWVRETWAHTTLLGNAITVYNAEDNRTDYGGPWKPSIHMRRADARIFLRVESVTVERVQEITEEDARAEGIGEHPVCDQAMILGCTYRDAFRLVWDSLAPAGSKWADNPWVWVVKFKRVPHG